MPLCQSAYKKGTSCVENKSFLLGKFDRTPPTKGKSRNDALVTSELIGCEASTLAQAGHWQQVNRRTFEAAYECLPATIPSDGIAIGGTANGQE
jgi:hypothetical protein